jgi:hypothetical protein
MAFRIYSSTQDPTRHTGSTGDYFVNTRRWTVFGPKSRAGWGGGSPIWPDGMPPQPVPAGPVRTTADDVPLATRDGSFLATDGGAVLAGDLRPDDK